MTLHSAITTVTHNIPWFLRQPATALIGEKCYTTLVYDFNITDVECLKYALSKGLGFGIVLGGSIVKIPQIIKIVKNHTTRGLSLSAYNLETVSYAISLAYAARGGFPFSTYGENLFITIQNIAIILMILYYTTPRSSYSGLGGQLSAPSSSPSAVRRVTTGLIIIVLFLLFLWNRTLCPPSTLAFLQLSTIPIGLLSKAPQIMENYTNRSTGNLSAFAVFSALIGCLARMFTTKQEIKDPIVFWGFAGATLLNMVVAFQMVMYWQSPGDDLLDTKARFGKEGSIMEEGPTGRWSRKLD